MNRIALTENQAEEMYNQINAYYLFLQCAENVDKCFFAQIKFWNPTMNNHLRKARESTSTLLQDFNRHFRPINHDTVHYEAPAELYRAMEFLSRKSPDVISQIMDELEGSEREATAPHEHLTAS